MLIKRNHFTLFLIPRFLFQPLKPPQIVSARRDEMLRLIFSHFVFSRAFFFSFFDADASKQERVREFYVPDAIRRLRGQTKTNLEKNPKILNHQAFLSFFRRDDLTYASQVIFTLSPPPPDAGSSLAKFFRINFDNDKRNSGGVWDVKKFRKIVTCDECNCAFCS